MRLVIADPDVSYGRILQIRFSESFHLEPLLVTGQEALNQCMKGRFSDTVLILSEAFTVPPGNYRMIFLLTSEEGTAFHWEESGRQMLYRYAPVPELLNAVGTDLRLNTSFMHTVHRKRHLLLFLGADSMAEKTALALRTASILSESGKEVLYLNGDSLQSFGTFFPEETESLNPPLAKDTYADEELQKLRGQMRNSSAYGCRYLPPVPGPLCLYGLTEHLYSELIFRELQKFPGQYVIYDAPAGLSPETLKLCGTAERIFVIAEAQEQAERFRMALPEGEAMKKEDKLFFFEIRRGNRRSRTFSEASGILFHDSFLFPDELYGENLPACVRMPELQKIRVYLR